MKTAWKDVSFLHKIVSGVALVIAIIIIVLSLLQILGIWEKAMNVCLPLMGIELLCQAYAQWASNRKTAYFSIGTAAFIFCCAIVVFFVK